MVNRWAGPNTSNLSEQQYFVCDTASQSTKQQDMLEICGACPPLTSSRLRLYFLWLRMLSVSLNKGYFYKTHIAYRLALIHSTCSSSLKSEVWIIHANTPTALSRFRNFIFRHRDVVQKNISSVKETLPLQSSSQRQDLMLISPPNG